MKQCGNKENEVLDRPCLFFGNTSFTKKKALDKNWSIPYNEFKKEVEVL
jgi:hypothetical protein